MTRTGFNPTFGSRPYWHLTTEQVQSYARRIPGGMPHLQLYTTPDPSGTFDWFFAHREVGKAAVHNIPIVRDARGREYVHVIVQKAPVMGGRPIVQLPAGLWGDKNPTESALAAASRELKEETGYRVQGARVLADQLFATSPGMTTEMKAFALVNATGTPTDRYRDAGEKGSIIASFDVPISTFRNYNKFMAWMNAMQARGYTIGIDILAARALLPPTRAGRQLDLMG